MACVDSCEFCHLCCALLESGGRVGLGETWMWWVGVERRGEGLMRGTWANRACCSIREFCDLDTPILMFDKDGAFVVMKLEQVLYFFPVKLIENAN